MNDSVTRQLALTLGHLYPDQLNLYGDRGNIIVLRRRCQQRGIELRVVSLGLGDALAPDEYDMLFIGGGQDREQAPVAQDLHDTIMRGRSFTCNSQAIRVELRIERVQHVGDLRRGDWQVGTGWNLHVREHSFQGLAGRVTDHSVRTRLCPAQSPK